MTKILRLCCFTAVIHLYFGLKKMCPVLMINPQVKIHYWKNGGGKTFCKMLLGSIFPKRYCHQIPPSNCAWEAPHRTFSTRASAAERVNTLTSYPWTQDFMTPGFPQIFGVFFLQYGWKEAEKSWTLPWIRFWAQGNDTLRFEPVVDSQGRRACLVACWMNTPAASKNLYHLDHPSALPKPWCGCASSCLRTAFGSA